MSPLDGHYCIVCADPVTTILVFPSLSVRTTIAICDGCKKVLRERLK